MQHTSFYNKNEFRKYPLRATSKYTTLQGIDLPISLFCGISVTTTYAKSDLYLSQMVIQDSWISVTLKDNGTNETLGAFTGVPLADGYTNLRLSCADNKQDGFLIIGSRGLSISPKGTFEFDYTNGKIEDSAIMINPLPVVSSFIHFDKSLTGLPDLTLQNISSVITGDTINLSVIDPALIIARGVFSSSFGNCVPPPIMMLNTVTPDANGNIDIYGVDPIEIEVGNFTVALSTGAFELPDLCKANQKNIPPINTADTNPAYGTATQEEWTSWPQIAGS